MPWRNFNWTEKNKNSVSESDPIIDANIHKQSIYDNWVEKRENCHKKRFKQTDKNELDRFKQLIKSISQNVF